MSMILLAASPASTPDAALNDWGACSGWSTYDATKIVEITAAIEEVRWDEAIVCVKHEGAWKEIHLAPVARLAARGLRREALTAGKTVTIEAYPSTTNANELRAERIVVDGRVVALR